MAPSRTSVLSQCFTWNGYAFSPRSLEYICQIAPAGSASSTADDMARYMIALLDGGRLGETQVYGERTARALQTPLRLTPTGVNGWRHGFIAYALPGGLSGFGHYGPTLTFLPNITPLPALGPGTLRHTHHNPAQTPAHQLAPV